MAEQEKDDAALMAAFDKAVPETGDAKPAAPAKAESAEKDEQPEVEAAADKQGDAPEVEESQADEPGDPELERAWSALERDGWRKSEIKKLGVETIKVLGLKRAKNQEEVDRAYEDLKALKAKAKAEKPEAQPHDTVDAKDDISGALAELEALDPGAAKVLKTLAAEVEAIKKNATERSVAEAQRESKRIRTKVSELYSEAKGDVAWNAVLSAAQGIAEKEDVLDAEAAIGMALEAIYGKREAKQPKQPVKADRLGDLPESPTRKHKTQPASKEEREWAAFNAVVDGADRKTAERVFSGQK